ncbi:MAG: hypothetical protein ABIR37_01085 [Candidatus Saccharimonadales bacterium]
METLQRTPDDEDNLDNVLDRAEAHAIGIDILDVSGGIAHLEHDANFPYSMLPAAGYLALRGSMPPFNRPL